MAVLLLQLPTFTTNTTFPSNQSQKTRSQPPIDRRLRLLLSRYPQPKRLSFFPLLNSSSASASAGGGGEGKGRSNGGWGGGSGRWWSHGNLWSNDGDDGSGKFVVVCLVSLLCGFSLSSLAIARTTTATGKVEEEKSDVVAWEVRGGNWTRLVTDLTKDVFLVDGRKLGSGVGFVDLELLPSSSRGLDSLLLHCRDVFMRLMLPEGYPKSVTSDYLEYSLWRGVQGIASQISGVLSTQALLYAVGLGKGAIPTAAALNWVLKDGLGYLSKILLSKYGRHFDVNPKGWRLFADLLENAAYGLEILTPAFPQLFVPIGAVAGAGRSASSLIQAATRSCFQAGFAAQRNFAEVIAKAEAQGMVSKFIGIAIGIALANYVHNSTTLALAAFGVITGIHMYSNLKSYQSIQLRTLNPYRASLVFSEYLLSGQVPSVKEVNDEEPLFPLFPFLDVKSLCNDKLHILSPEARNAALHISSRLQLGCKLSMIVHSKEDVLSLFNLFKDEGYMLAEKDGRFCVVLKESASLEDMLKAVFHVNYLYWLETNVAWLERKSLVDECKQGGRLHISLDYSLREFNHVRNDSQQVGWITDGLIARPLPYRIRPGYDD